MGARPNNLVYVEPGMEERGRVYEEGFLLAGRAGIHPAGAAHDRNGSFSQTAGTSPNAPLISSEPSWLARTLSLSIL